MTRRKRLWGLSLVVVLALAVTLGYSRVSFQLKALYWSYEMGRGKGTLQVGDLAPDFELRYKKSDETARLSSFRGEKPVALVFGSYT